ncbi:MAG TPA: cytochrome C [Desulfonatronum sp.]|nr:cytochrome C [Desulfonatronum sp.]
MYDGNKIIPGLVIFLGLITFPFWYNIGSAAYEKPQLKLPEIEKECVEPKDWIRAEHMQLLDDWRDLAVRDNTRLYVNQAGKSFDMSLSKTCMSSRCHANKAEFCDRCHDALAVSPYCWDCHVEPPIVEE